MIQKAVKQWDAHKGELEAYFRSTPMGEYDSYDKILRLVIDKVLNADECGMHIVPTYDVIDHGDYQGVQIYILHTDSYQPLLSEYILTHNYYGSCSGCDTLLSITRYDDGIPDEDQVRGFMLISLHLVQNMRYLMDLYKSEPAVD